MEGTNFKRSTGTVKKFFSVKRMTIMAMMTALTVIVARFCAIQFTDSLRLGFDMIPVILTSVWLGPVYGMLVGGLADVIGSLINLFGGAYFPMLTITPMLTGLIAGLLAKYVFKNNLNFFKFMTIVLIANIVGQLLYGTWALSCYLKWFYGLSGKVAGETTTFTYLFVGRLTKFITFATDIVIGWILHKALYQRVIKKML